MKKAKLPSISLVKKTLYDDWALRVKERDGWKCVLCGATKDLTAHHWYVSDHHAHAARYANGNGITLCYACHIRAVHTRADYVTISKLAEYMAECGYSDRRCLDRLVAVELTVPRLRCLWAAMRTRVLNASSYAQLKRNGSKLFLHSAEHVKRFVPYNVIQHKQQRYEVLVVAKTPDGTYRYTVRLLDGEENKENEI
jgi:hypothetical protein